MSTTPASTTPTDRAPSAQAGAELVPFDLAIGGMTCASCAARIERKLNKLDGVDAAVNYATDRASVVFDPARVPLDTLLATVESVGYSASLPRAAGDATHTDDARNALRTVEGRLVVSALLTAPLVLLAMVSPFQFAGWEWVALALAAPVVLWGGWPFHRAALLNARHAAATMDTLISLGTLAALGWSAVVLFAGLDAETYF